MWRMYRFTGCPISQAYSGLYVLVCCSSVIASNKLWFQWLHSKRLYHFTGQLRLDALNQPSPRLAVAKNSPCCHRQYQQVVQMAKKCQRHVSKSCPKAKDDSCLMTDICPQSHHMCVCLFLLCFVFFLVHWSFRFPFDRVLVVGSKDRRMLRKINATPISGRNPYKDLLWMSFPTYFFPHKVPKGSSFYWEVRIHIWIEGKLVGICGANKSSWPYLNLRESIRLITQTNKKKFSRTAAGRLPGYINQSHYNIVLTIW